MFPIIVCALVTTCVWYILQRTIFHCLRNIPGPTSWPIVGNAWQLDHSQAHLDLTEWQKRYGSIFRIALYSHDYVVIAGTENLMEAMVNRSADFAERPTSFRTEYATYGRKGIIYGKYDKPFKWLKKQAHVNLHLYGEGMKQIEMITKDAVSDMTDKMESLVNEPFNPFSLVFDYTLSTIFIILFGDKPDLDSELFQRTKHMVIQRTTSSSHTQMGSAKVLDIFPLLRHFGKYKAAFDKMYKARSEFATLYSHCVSEYEKGNLKGIMYEMFKIEQVPSGIEFTPEHMAMFIQDMILAGTMTTTSTFTSLLNVLVFNPDVQRKLQEEVDDVVGVGRLPGCDDVAEMNYTRAVVFEISRYASILPLSVPHMTTCDTKVGDYAIPKGTRVQMNLWFQHHDATIYKDPMTFNPERFLDANGHLVLADSPVRKGLMAFGHGARHCVGENLALTRLFMFTASVMQKFHVLPATTINEQVECDARNTIFSTITRPKPFKVRLVLRE